ncbi:MAG: glycosyltransferase family 87 protein [Albidovulum sp.]|uniref:glycosyltransferase family 87 protein n=1 Tax=Albidovulum sp. TaxID=1872424 RepID=UPI003CB19C95
MTEPQADRPLGAGSITPTRDRQISILMLALWTLVTVWQQWGHWAEDLSAVYIAASLWQSGQTDLIYAAPPGFFGGVAASWLPVMDQLGIGQETSFPYVYPPLWAAFIGPLTGPLSIHGFFNLMTLLQVPMLAGSVLLTARILKSAAMPLWLWTTLALMILNLSIQSHVALWHNQPTISVTFLTLLAFERLNADRPVAAGIALALAAAIKLTPAAFVLIFLIDRQHRATAAFMIAGAALAGLSIALTGWPLHQAFLDSVRQVSDSALLTEINITLRTAILALGSATHAFAPIDMTVPHIYRSPPGWLGPTVALAGLVLLALILRALSPLTGPTRRGIGLFVASVILSLFGPLGWQHYYLLPMLLLPGLVGLLPKERAMLPLAAIVLPSLYFVFEARSLLPWPAATVVWIFSAGWLAVLAALFHAARSQPR